MPVYVHGCDLMLFDYRFQFTVGGDVTWTVVI